MFHQYGRVNQHAHRHKEYGTKEVFYRFHQFDDTFGLNGFSKNRAHDKGTEGTAETHLGGKHGHGTAQAQGHDEQRLVVDQLARGAQQQRNQRNAHHKPHHEEETNLHHAAQHLFAVGIVAHGNGREHHHHDNGKDIFQDEHAHHDASKALLPQAEVVERLVDNGGGTHGQHAP